MAVCLLLVSCYMHPKMLQCQTNISHGGRDGAPALDYHFPANTRRWLNVVLMLGQRRRQWANIKPTLRQRLVFAGLWSPRLTCRTSRDIGQSIYQMGIKPFRCRVIVGIDCCLTIDRTLSLASLWPVTNLSKSVASPCWSCSSLCLVYMLSARCLINGPINLHIVVLILSGHDWCLTAIQTQDQDQQQAQLCTNVLNLGPTVHPCYIDCLLVVRWLVFNRAVILRVE